MYHVIVREKKIVAAAGILSAAAGIIFLVLCAGSGAAKQDRSGMLLGGLIFGGMIVLGLLMLASYFFRRLCLGYTNCYYQTMFGRRTEFCLRDIKKVEQKLKLGELMLILRGSGGKTLARLEMNMKNAEKILPFLKEYQLPAVKEDPAWQNKGSWGNIKKRYADYKRSRYYPERQRNYRKAAEEEWEGVSGSSEMSGWIRLLAVILNVSGAAAAFFIWGESREKAAVWFVLYPLAVYGFYFAFPRVLIWDINTRNPEKEKRDYVQMPVIGLGMIMGCGILRLRGLNIEEEWKMAVFEAAVLIVSVAFLLFLFKRKRILELGLPIILLCISCYTNAYYLNCMFQTGEPEHVRAEVIGKRISGDGDGRAGDSRYLTFRTRDGREAEAEVVYSLYEKTGEGDQVLICRHEGIFGIHYYHVHL